MGEPSTIIAALEGGDRSDGDAPQWGRTSADGGSEGPKRHPWCVCRWTLHRHTGTVLLGQFQIAHGGGEEARGLSTRHHPVIHGQRQREHTVNGRLAIDGDDA